MAFKLNRHGQSIVEFTLVTGFVLIPLISGGSLWFTSEFNRSKCSYLAFFNARDRLIKTQAGVQQVQVCGDLREAITLEPLPSLEEKGHGSSYASLKLQASQLWEAVLHFLPPSRVPGSTD